MFPSNTLISVQDEGKKIKPTGWKKQEFLKRLFVWILKKKDTEQGNILKTIFQKNKVQQKR